MFLRTFSRPGIEQRCFLLLFSCSSSTRTIVAMIKSSSSDSSSYSQNCSRRSSSEKSIYKLDNHLQGHLYICIYYIFSTEIAKKPYLLLPRAIGQQRAGEVGA